MPIIYRIAKLFASARSGSEGADTMAIESQIDVTPTPNTPVDDRAVWTAPTLQFFEAVSAENGNYVGQDIYDLS
jgi:hypothetical protein